LKDNTIPMNKSQLNFFEKINLNYEKMISNGLYEFSRDFFLLIIFLIFLIFFIRVLKKFDKIYLTNFINRLISLSFKTNPLIIELQENKKS
jgi:hypothetical protein